MKSLKKLFKDESGATAIEYGLIAALIAVFIILALQGVGGALEETFQGVEDGLTTGNAG